MPTLLYIIYGREYIENLKEHNVQKIHEKFLNGETMQQQSAAECLWKDAVNSG